MPRGREHDNTHSSTRHRSRSRAFLDAVNDHSLRGAVTALKPGSSSESSRSRSRDRDRHDHRHHSQRSQHHHHQHHPRGRHHDEYEHRDRPRRHRSTHHHHHHPSHSHSDARHRHHHHRRASSAGPNLKQAAGAAVAAGMVEAWRSRGEGDRVSRVATAAVGAAATDALLAGDKGRGRDPKTKRHVVESVVAGLVETRAINGPRG
ncbi:hypothetical protein F5Y15DRAFT_377920 [Xylariaceae sp. FL0016]|nr:hypothetical protein F5Y15DRAFT_377920 [Xylariaceae sp. FL0016]